VFRFERVEFVCVVRTDHQFAISSISTRRCLQGDTRRRAACRSQPCARVHSSLPATHETPSDPSEVAYYVRGAEEDHPQSCQVMDLSRRVSGI
jgi:hypothetical protein